MLHKYAHSSLSHRTICQPIHLSMEAVRSWESAWSHTIYSITTFDALLQFIRPHQLTYKYRLQPTRRLIRPPTVGPGSAESRYGDVFHQLGIDPLDQCMNPQLLSHFVSDMGKIYGRHITKLTTRSQRRLGKAIRRAKMMGVIPILSKAKKSSWIYRR